MEESETMQTETSWLSVICGACGILLLATYIIWSPDEKNTPSSVHPEKAEIQNPQPFSSH